MTLICSTLTLDRDSSDAENELGSQFVELHVPYLVALEETSCLLGTLTTHLDSHAYHEQMNMARCTVIAPDWLPY